MTVEIKLFDDLEDVAADAGDALGRARQPSLYDRIDWFQRGYTYGIAECLTLLDPGTPIGR